MTEGIDVDVETKPDGSSMALHGSWDGRAVRTRSGRSPRKRAARMASINGVGVQAAPAKKSWVARTGLRSVCEQPSFT
jgi:hypothetical protein